MVSFFLVHNSTLFFFPFLLSIFFLLTPLLLRSVFFYEVLGSLELSGERGTDKENSSLQLSQKY